MNERVFVSHSEDETRELGRRLGESIEAGVCVLLNGDLGAGKTVLVRGVGEALGIDGVRSPSFTLINEYESTSPLTPLLTQERGNMPGVIIHADLYRLDDAGSLGLEDYEDAVLFVEWPDRWRNPPSDNVLSISISSLNESEREIKILANGVKAERVLMNL